MKKKSNNIRNVADLFGLDHVQDLHFVITYTKNLAYARYWGGGSIMSYTVRDKEIFTRKLL